MRRASTANRGSLVRAGSLLGGQSSAGGNNMLDSKGQVKNSRGFFFDTRAGKQGVDDEASDAAGGGGGQGQEARMAGMKRSKSYAPAPVNKTRRLDASLRTVSSLLTSLDGHD